MAMKIFLAAHGTTLEVTKDEEITKKADCIVGWRQTRG